MLLIYFLSSFSCHKLQCNKISYAESSISTKSKEQDECLDGFVLRHDAKRPWWQSPEKFVTYSPNKKRTDRMVSPL